LEGNSEAGLSFCEVTADHGHLALFTDEFLNSDGSEALASTRLVLKSNVANLER
jgi:hypothetical protein